MFDPIGYTKKNSFTVSRTAPVKSAETGCIDDRRRRDEVLKQPYAIPGGILGISLDVMATAYHVVESQGYKVEGLKPRRLFALCSEAVGGIFTFHTETNKDTFPCAGCGYCSASLKEDGVTFFSPEVADFLKQEALFECMTELEKNGIPVPAYDIPHAAKAVVVVNSLEIGVHATSEDGEHVFVYHPKARELYLKRVLDSVYTHVKEVASDVTHEMWENQVFAVAENRLQKVLKVLKADTLPMVTVSFDGSDVVVEEIAA